MAGNRNPQLIALAVTSLLIVLGALVTMTERGFAQPGPTERAEIAKAGENFEKQAKEKLAAILRTYKERKTLEHLHVTAAMLALMNNTSVRPLLKVGDEVSVLIEMEGIGPYLSISVDLAYRFGRIDRPETTRIFRRLSKVSLKKLDRIKPGAYSSMYALLREEGSTRYRVYDARTARAAARLLFTEAGRLQLRAGQVPLSFSRTAAMLWECQKNVANDRLRGPKPSENCRKFTSAAQNALTKGGQAGQFRASLGDVGAGAKTGIFSCFQAESSAQKLIGQMESYLSCMSSRGPQRGQPLPVGATMALGYETYQGDHPNLPGWDYVQSKAYDELLDTDGWTKNQVDHEYKNSTGGDATVSEWAATKDGQTESGSATTTNDGKGTQSQSMQDANGNQTWSFTEKSDGTTELKDDKGNTYEAKPGPDGKTFIKVTDKDGHAKEGVIDKDGKCSGEACNASTPVGEWAVSGCGPIGGIPGRKELGRFDPLGPYIYPAPDSTGTMSPTMACVVSTFGGASGKSCPPSVALCVEPPPPGECGCGKPAELVAVPAYAATCSKMQCGEGSSCNQSTGTCTSGPSGGFSPGVPTPRPPFRPGVPTKPSGLF